jgi:tRNA (cmo5U34)-methyltransferase
MDVKQAFDAAARDYDQLRRQLIPCFDPFYDMAVELLPFASETPLRVLDVGAGTGLLAERVARRFPRAELTLLDLSQEMLARAQTRFAGASRVRFEVGDYCQTPLGGPFDAVVSALSIHHLPDADKRALYARVLAALAPGGIFVNADNVCADDPEVQRRDRRAWIAAIQATGIDPKQLDAALDRTRVDILAPLGLQLGWLRELGYREVDCAFKWRHFVVFSGRRPT